MGSLEPGSHSVSNITHHRNQKNNASILQWIHFFPVEGAWKSRVFRGWKEHQTSREEADKAITCRLSGVCDEGC